MIRHTAFHKSIKWSHGLYRDRRIFHTVEYFAHNIYHGIRWLKDILPADLRMMRKHIPKLTAYIKLLSPSSALRLHGKSDYRARKAAVVFRRRISHIQKFFKIIVQIKKFIGV